MRQQAEVEARYVPTAAQSRFATFETVTGASQALPLLIELDGPFSAAALEAAFGAATRDFDVLRSGFCPDAKGGIEVNVLRQAALEIAHIELCASPKGDAERCAEALAGACAQRRLDVTRPPLARAVVVRLMPARHLLCLVVHHALVDEWSMRLVTTRVAEGYAAARAGRPLPRHAARPFHAVAGEIELNPNTPFGARSMAFWRETLAGAPTRSAPPPDRERTGRRASVARRIVRHFQPGLMATLDAALPRLGATRFAVLAGALALVIARLADQRDVLLAMSISARRRRDLAGVVGPLINTSVLRVDLTDAHDLASVAGRTAAALAAALAHTGATFDDLYHALRPEAGPGATPFAQVLLSQRLDSGSPPSIPGLRVRTREAGRRAATYDLSASIAVDGDTLVASCDYLEALYDEATVAALLSAWEAALVIGLADPAAPILSLEPAPATTAAHALSETRGGVRLGGGFLERIDGLARTEPDRMALVDVASGVVLTRRFLARSADAIARGLDAEGLAPGSAVGVSLRPGPMLWSVCLGILQAGCAVAPLRAREPARLRADQASAARLALVVGEDAAEAGFFAVPHATPDGLKARAADGARRPLPPDGVLATAISTSGSTGRPKLVEVPRCALDAVVRAFNRENLLGSRNRIIAVTDVSFDIAFLETLGALACGVTVALAPEGAAGDGAALAHHLASCEADAMQATPFTWSRLMHAGWRGAPGFLALCGGEAADPKLAAWLDGLPGRALNVYGPTETAIWSAEGPMRGRSGAAPIGRALWGETLHVLDAALLPTPRGGVGELFIGGIGLAHGYRDAPVLTARAFRPDAFGTPGARFYATGDRVRVEADGALAFRGRADAQAKLRGFRIELDGVARRLAEHSAVSSCVASVATDARRGPVLAAHVRLAPEVADPDAVLADLRHFARERLPAHSVPAAFVPVVAFPETPTGKIDRARLPPIEERHFVVTRAQSAPRNAAEAAVAAIWSEVLGIKGLDMEDDFFALGGTSLDAVAVASAVAARLDPTFTLASFLDKPSIAAVARRVGNGGLARLPAPVSGAPGRRVPLSPIIGLRVARELALVGRADLNVHLVMRLRGPFRPTAFAHGLRVLTARHDALRTRFGLDEAGLHLQAAPPWTVEPDLTTADLGALAPAALGRTVAGFVQRPFDLKRAPTLRFGLFRIEPEETILAVAGSHLVLDGWSLARLVHELGTLYRQAARPGSPASEAPLIQFPDVVAWQSALIASAGFAEDLAYWIERLKPPPPPVFPARPDQPRRVASVERDLGPDRAAALNAAAQVRACTPFACFAACFARALRRLTGARDIALILPAANRDAPGLNGVVGLVMNPILLRLSVDDVPLAEAVAAAWQETCAANRHAACPVDLALDVLERAGRGLVGPVSDVYVLWNEIGFAGLDLPDVAVALLPDLNRLASRPGEDAVPLQIDVGHGPGQLVVSCVLRIDALDRAGGERMLDLLAEELDCLAEL